jgi:hypothetical protein
MTDDERLCGEFADRLLGFALKAERVLSKDAIFYAFLASAVAFAKHHGIPELSIREHLHGAADTLEATEPPAPTLN